MGSDFSGLDLAETDHTDQVAYHKYCHHVLLGGGGGVGVRVGVTRLFQCGSALGEIVRRGGGASGRTSSEPDRSRKKSARPPPVTMATDKRSMRQSRAGEKGGREGRRRAGTGGKGASLSSLLPVLNTKSQTHGTEHEENEGGGGKCRRRPQYSQSVAVSRSSALAFSTPAWSPRRYLLSATWRMASLL